ncbi:DNA adenine methylase [Enterococcus casseliflavus]|uniref:DNA adenine methylase n=1 Tax=Enterococcus casseliflavus TaxID=37734 RepID=UPI000EB32627|nr:DNA adenine methylase [Enterococcus casseliflavus]AYJ45931.1 DNA adenine methylase [Enterococcus casseliflavus]MBE9898613.1 DNA adenine methylase [Enterococcus casseliflavus]MBE9901899.1 DNA adenine methylase [Enterococcus casseliflavus]MBE9922306.1 DNA adenine methylase [Enterococcus casseliflavus]WRO95824.1 DNA adenine methylase [Enterococcus casseliflavus]
MPHTKSPLRYPGGKTQLWKFVKSTIMLNQIENPIYCEPFAGGSGVTMELLLGNHVNEVIINDFDPAIYSIWSMIINRSKEFIELIERTPVTLEEWHKQKNIYLEYGKNPESLLGAFSTFFLNRTNVSGIISGGPIGGQNQSGKYKIDCRFNKKTSISKISRIAEYRDKIHLYNEDASNLVDILKTEYTRENLFTFFDPPYFVQGQSLYLSFYDESQHELMRNKILEMDDYYWILTYDKAPQISDLYSKADKSFEYSLNYSANKRRMANEYIFASSVTKLKSYDKVKLLSLH